MSTGGGAAGAAGAGVGSNGAGLAGNGSNGDGGDAANGQQQQQGQAFDPGQIAQMLQGLQGSQEQLRQQFSDFIGQQGQDADGGDYGDDGDVPDEVADVLAETGWEYAGEMERRGSRGARDSTARQDSDPADDPATMANVLGDAFADFIRGELAPLQQEVAEARRETQEAKLESEYRQLASEFPDLGEARNDGGGPGRRAGLRDGARPTTEDGGRSRVARLVYMAGRAADAANAEDDDSPQSAFLEGGAGGAPSGGRVDAGDAIVNPQLAGGALGSRALPFS
jgi:hypothetical protein